MKCARWLLVAVLAAAMGSAQVDQRPGINGEFGKSYHLGSADNGIEFTLKSVEYSVSRANVGDTCYASDKASRLMIIHYSAQNATRDDMQTGSLVTFTAVTAEKENREMQVWPGVEGTNQYLPDNLKPAQRIECFSVIPVPDKDVVPKLIAMRTENDNVIRYSLDGKIKPLPAKYADPADKTGLTPLESLPAKAGELTPMGPFDLRVDKWETLTGTIPDSDLADGYYYFAVTVTLKNQSRIDYGVDASNWASLVTEDDAKVENPLLVSATRPKIVELEVKAGAELTARLVFQVEKDTKVKSFVMHGPVDHGFDSESRPVVVMTTEAPKP
ncbi:MAG: DUF4352 domain-containing protein [Armatimonadetes bacterium]|nr:DUF4352 domain-containing protein [Armatimonadota bacterium]